MPMFRSFVPRKIQPWIYLFIAVTFQLSGGVYLGALNQMIGGMALMREDILMCMYANLAGMAIYFPCRSAWSSVLQIRRCSHRLHWGYWSVT